MVGEIYNLNMRWFGLAKKCLTNVGNSWNILQIDNDIILISPTVSAFSSFWSWTPLDWAAYIRVLQMGQSFLSISQNNLQQRSMSSVRSCGHTEGVYGASNLLGRVGFGLGKLFNLAAMCKLHSLGTVISPVGRDKAFIVSTNLSRVKAIGVSVIALWPHSVYFELKSAWLDSPYWVRGLITDSICPRVHWWHK